MRYLFLLFLAACAAPSEYHQGAFRPAPPVFVPSQDAPHTVGQPGHVKPDAEYPRSPHRRPLPPTREPGIWAGDEPRAGKKPGPTPHIIGVPLPYPEDLNDPKEDHFASECAREYDRFIKFHKMEAMVRAVPDRDRACLAAWLYEHCLSEQMKWYKAATSTGEILEREYAAALTKALQTALGFKATVCEPKHVHPWDANTMEVFEGLAVTYTRSNGPAR